MSREGHSWKCAKVLACVQPQAIVDVPPHPACMASSFKHYVGNALHSQLLRGRKPGWPSSHDDSVDALNRHDLHHTSTLVFTRREASTGLNVQLLNHLPGVIPIRQTQQLIFKLDIPHGAGQLGFDSAGRPTLRHYLNERSM